MPARVLAMVGAIVTIFGLVRIAEAAAGSIEIVYPEQGQTVRHDTIPIWLRSCSPELFARMRASFNGEEFTARFLPWGPRGRGLCAEAIATVRPRHGENSLVLSVEGASGGRAVQTRYFQFEPHELKVQIRVVEDGRDVPARVAIFGIDGTRNARLAPRIWREISNVGMADEQARKFLYTAGSPVDLHLPAGKYEVIASRGPAYSIARAELGPRTRRTTLELEQVVDTQNWTSADFHAHAIPSGDSSLPLRDRIRSYIAQDVDVIVASDHNTITSYKSVLARDDPLEVISGVEAGVPRGDLSLGHWGIWPLVPDENDETILSNSGRSYGGFAHDASSASDLYAYFEGFNAEARRRVFGPFPIVVQLNHPRGILFHPHGPLHRSHDYLNRIGYDPLVPLSASENGRLLASPGEGRRRAIDVDAIELLNRLSFALYERVRRDWFAWISQGFVPTATANTDSHWLVITEAGYPRNWIRLPDSTPATAATVARAVRDRQVVGSTGPLLEIEPFPADGRPLRGPLETLDITVRSPAWIPVEEVRIYVDGKLAHKHRFAVRTPQPFAASEDRYRLSVPVGIRRDAFITVEAGDAIPRLISKKRLPGPIGRLFPNLRVLAFTNPLLVDADSNGTRWDRFLTRYGEPARSAAPHRPAAER